MTGQKFYIKYNKEFCMQLRLRVRISPSSNTVSQVEGNQSQDGYIHTECLYKAGNNHQPQLLTAAPFLQSKKWVPAPDGSTSAVPTPHHGKAELPLSHGRCRREIHGGTTEHHCAAKSEIGHFYHNDNWPPNKTRIPVMQSVNAAH